MRRTNLLLLRRYVRNTSNSVNVLLVNGPSFQQPVLVGRACGRIWKVWRGEHGFDDNAVILRTAGNGVETRRKRPPEDPLAGFRDSKKQTTKLGDDNIEDVLIHDPVRFGRSPLTLSQMKFTHEIPVVQ